MQMRWFAAEIPGAAQAPRWMTSLGVSWEDNEVFIPAATGGDEAQVCRRAAQERIPFVENHGHAYVPLAWVSRTFPSAQGICGILAGFASQVIRQDRDCVKHYAQLAMFPGEMNDPLVCRTLDLEYGYSRRQIMDAMWFIPTAFGRRVLEASDDKFQFSKVFYVLAADGEVIRKGLLADSGIYSAAYELAPDLLNEQLVAKLVMRSAEVAAHQRALADNTRHAVHRTPLPIFFDGNPTEAGLKRAEELAQTYARI